MERWAANTLRTLGIILTAGFVLLTSLFLLLLSLCAAGGGLSGIKHPEQVVPYSAAAVAVLGFGIWFIAWLARGFQRSSAVAERLPAGVPTGVLLPAPSGSPAPSLPFHLSPLGRKAIDSLVFALIVQIAVSAGAWIFGQLHYWSRPNAFASHNWTLLLLAPYVLYQVPYAILIYVSSQAARSPRVCLCSCGARCSPSSVPVQPRRSGLLLCAPAQRPLRRAPAHYAEVEQGLKKENSGHRKSIGKRAAIGPLEEHK